MSKPHQSGQLLSHVQFFATPWTDCSMPGLPVRHQLPELAQTHVHRVNDAIQPYLILSRPLLLPSIFPRIRVFSSESVLCIRWPKYWRFSFNISPFNEYSGLISIRMDWLDLLAVQGTLKSLLCMRQALGPGALGRPGGIVWRGRWEEGLGWRTHVDPWLFHFNV